MAIKLFKQALIASTAALLLAGCGSGQQEPAAVVAKPAVKEPAIKQPAVKLPAEAFEKPVVVEQSSTAAEQSPTLADDSSVPAVTLPAEAFEKPVFAEQSTAAAEQSPTLADDSSASAAGETDSPAAE